MARVVDPVGLEERVKSLPHVQRRLDELAAELAQEARDLTRLRALDSGRLAANIHVRHNGVGRIVRMQAGPGEPPMLPIWTEKGTGVYGPRGRPIRAKKPGGVMVFKVKGGAAPAGLPSHHRGDVVFARQVKGKKPVHIMRDAVTTLASRHRLRFGLSKL